MNLATVRLLYSAVILVGAFLSFEIQPLVGKIVTAGFGGSAAIWGVCLLFFQGVLLFGYTLTYILARLSARKQCIAYVLVVLCSALCLNLPGPSAWAADTQGEVAQTLLLVLASHLAFPCLILSSISGMIQTWFNLSRLGNPYPLYSLSNIGSLGALLAYPVFIEPMFTLTNTLSVWRISYYALCALVCLAAVYMYRQDPLLSPAASLSSGASPTLQEQEQEHALLDESPSLGTDSKSTEELLSQLANSAHEAAPGSREFIWWILLSSMGTLALVSYTAYLTQDIAPVPLIYVIPLCLYLISFIITFAGDRFYKREVLIYLTPILWLVEAGISALWVDKTHLTVSMLWSLGAVLAFMFAFFMTCQGELYRSKPAAKHLASFYLAIAFGGTLGGAFVNFAAPVLFNSYMERYMVGAFIGLLWTVVVADNFHNERWGQIANYFYALMATGASVFLVIAGNGETGKLISQQRNFFGCMTIVSREDYVALKNGRIMHGKQFVDNAHDRLIPTLYYKKGTGVDLADYYLREINQGKPMRYGLIGLGAGTIAAYGQPGDTIVYYEIDPKVIAGAHKFFSFLADSKANVSVIAGDARAKLRKQEPQKFNLLVVDAFNGDAIPVHLLTKESLGIYFNHLVPDGILLVHVTNRFIDLEPVLGNLAGALNLKAFTLSSDDGDYVALSRAPGFLLVNPSDEDHKERYEDLSIRPVKTYAPIGIWSDDYSNLFATMVAKVKQKN